LRLSEKGADDPFDVPKRQRHSRLLLPAKECGEGRVLGHLGVFPLKVIRSRLLAKCVEAV
jgi:hypothetical protein